MESETSVSLLLVPLHYSTPFLILAFIAAFLAHSPSTFHALLTTERMYCGAHIQPPSKAGPHHSGTTLMSLLVGQNSQVARLINTSVPQGEGQHLQDVRHRICVAFSFLFPHSWCRSLTSLLLTQVYPKAYNVGGMLRYAFSREAHLTEQSDLCTNTSAVRLFRSWSKHWVRSTLSSSFSSSSTKLHFQKKIHFYYMLTSTTRITRHNEGPHQTKSGGEDAKSHGHDSVLAAVVYPETNEVCHHD